jgi:hypothetical protein
MKLVALNLGDRPSWQRDACPAWCTATHRENDHADDRVHHSDGITVATVGWRRHVVGDKIVTTDKNVDLEVGIARDDGQQTTWLYIGSGPASSVEVALSAADELVGAILALRC